MIGQTMRGSAWIAKKQIQHMAKGAPVCDRLIAITHQKPVTDRHSEQTEKFQT